MGGSGRRRRAFLNRIKDIMRFKKGFRTRWRVKEGILWDLKRRKSGEKWRFCEDEIGQMEAFFTAVSFTNSEAFQWKQQ